MLEELRKKLEASKPALTPPGSDDIWSYNFNADPLGCVPGFSRLGWMPGKRSRDIKESRLGLGFETLDRDTFDPKKIFPHLAQSGVKWARCQTGWMKTEKEPGVYDFQWLDEVADGLLKIGIQPWFSLSYGNPLHTPCEKYAEAWRLADGKLVLGWARGYVGEVPLYHGEAAMEAWLCYVRALAAHFKGRVTHWEVWNEPEWFWRLEAENMHTKLGTKRIAQDYVEFTRRSAEAVRSVIPEAKIIADVAQTGTTYIRELGKNGLGDVIDIFSYHFYGNVPEAFMLERFRHIEANIPKRGGKLEIWQGESGRASGKSALFAMPTEYNQAKYLLRRHVTDILCGAAMTSFFSVTDFLGYYPDGSDQFYGVIDARADRPKLAFHALRTLGWLFDGLELAPDLLVAFSPHSRQNFGSALPYNVMSGAFRRKGVPLFCLWTPEHVDISAQPVDGVVQVVTDEDAPLKDPIVIDPLRGAVWGVDPALLVKEPDGGGFLGAMRLDAFRVVDYPLFLTEASLFEELLP